MKETDFNHLKTVHSIPEKFQNALNLCIEKAGIDLFKYDHYNYCDTLVGIIRDILNESDINDLFSDLKIDLSTLAYLTRHEIDDKNNESDWVMLGMATKGGKLEKFEDELQVYVYKRKPFSIKPPYFYLHEPTRNKNPMKILFKDKNYTMKGAKDDFISLNYNLVKKLSKSTKDVLNPEPPLTKKELNEFINIDPGNYKDILKRMRENIGDFYYSAEDIIGILRNGCRITIHMIKNKRKFSFIKLPRIVILTPVYVDKNLIGGIAFIGEKILSEFEIILLSLFSQILFTQIRLYEEPRREARIHEAEIELKTRESILKGITHYFDSPLSTIKSNISEAINLANSAQTGISILEESYHQLILSMSRGEPVLCPIEVNIREFFEVILFMKRNTFQKAGIGININDIPINWTLYVDKFALQEVINNLLSNALRYAASNIDILVNRIYKPKRYKIIISNDGSPVRADLRHSLFKPGITDNLQDDQKSHGYGLFWSDRIIKKMGGQIYLDSKKNTQFVIKIPIINGGNII